jgi:hypothetical protein
MPWQQNKEVTKRMLSTAEYRGDEENAFSSRI